MVFQWVEPTSATLQVKPKPFFIINLQFVCLEALCLLKQLVEMS